MYQRILIIGNSGSGKSWLADNVATFYQIPETNLDTLVWQPGGFSQKRPQHEVDALLAPFATQPCWVVEGVYGALAEQLAPFADTLIWLDIEWEVCKQSLISRGFKHQYYEDDERAQANFNALLCWAAEYHTRASKSAYAFHLQLFEQFTQRKYRLRSRQAVNDFVAAFT